MQTISNNNLKWLLKKNTNHIQNFCTASSDSYRTALSRTQQEEKNINHRQIKANFQTPNHQTNYPFITPRFFPTFTNAAIHLSM